MLIDKKFIYLSLPRCASTSFHYSCILNDVNVESHGGIYEVENSNVDFKKIDENNLMNYITHGHESINGLQSKFGYELPIIAVKRDRHERLYSLYKHILFDFQRVGQYECYKVFSKLSVDELFFFTKDDILTQKLQREVIIDYLLKLNLIDKKNIKPVLSKFVKVQDEYYANNPVEYIINIINILITPISYLTNNNPNIIWFDFKKLDELENWVSEKIGKPFKLQSVNSSKHIECDMILNDDFIKKYNTIYDFYDLPKHKKTLI